MNGADVAYRVLYTKISTKKRKTYQDGTLLLTSAYMALIDADGTDVYRKKCYMPIVTAGEEITLGTFELQIEEVVNVPTISPTPRVHTSLTIQSESGQGYVTHTSRLSGAKPAPFVSSKKCKVNNAIAPPLLAPQKIVLKKFVSTPSLPSYKIAPASFPTPAAPSSGLPYASVSVKIPPSLTTLVGTTKLMSSSSRKFNISNSGGSNESTSSNDVTNNNISLNTSSDIALDTALLRVMRPHQIEAANFLIRRLLGESVRKNCFVTNVITSDQKRHSSSSVLLSSSASSSSSLSHIDEKKINETEKLEKSKRPSIKRGMNKYDCSAESSGSDSLELTDSGSDDDGSNKIRNKIRSIKRNNSSYKNSSSSEGQSNSYNTFNSSTDSNSDSDSDGMFVEKPPRYVEEVEEEREVVPSGIFTGAILADEVVRSSDDVCSVCNLIIYMDDKNLTINSCCAFYSVLLCPVRDGSRKDADSYFGSLGVCA